MRDRNIGLCYNDNFNSSHDIDTDKAYTELDAEILEMSSLKYEAILLSTKKNDKTLDKSCTNRD